MTVFADRSGNLELTVAGFPTGLEGTVGVRVLDGDEEAMPRTTAGIVELVAPGVYRYSGDDGPTVPGTYQVAWDTGGDDPVWALEDLIVGGVAPSVATLPSGLALATVEGVKAYAGIEAEDEGQDALIADLIEAASSAVADFCAREFRTLADPGEARTFEYRGSGWISFGPYDLRADRPVTVSYAGDALDADYLALFPTAPRFGVFEALRLAPGLALGGRWPSPRRTDLPAFVEVAGDWGWPTIPRPVAYAVEVTVSTWLRRDVSAFSTTFSLNEGRLERPQAIPSAAQAMLYPYRKTGA